MEDLQKTFAGLQDGVVSYGPCQFPTLGFVVERFWRIESIYHFYIGVFIILSLKGSGFVPENFWEIQCSITKPDKHGKSATAAFSWKRNRLFDRQACAVVYDISFQQISHDILFGASF